VFAWTKVRCSLRLIEHMKVSKRGVLVCTIALVGLVGGAILRGTPPSVTHAAELAFTAPGQPTDRTPERYTGSFLDTTLSAMLSRIEVSVNPEDKVYAFPDPSLGVGSVLLVYRAQEVTLTDANKTRTLRTWAKTVAELAEEQNLDLAEQDKVSVALNSEIPVQKEAFSVQVTRVAESELTLTTTVPFTTTYTDDPEMEKGTNVTEQEGKNGTLKTTYLVRRENGVEVSRKVIKKEQTVDPVTKLVRRGTKIVLIDQGKASFYSLSGRQCGTNRYTAAHRTLPKGTQVKVTNTANGKSVVVTIDDRGPYIAGRVIDLSCDAFSSIASLGTGVISVKVEKP
jgi:rare lipoprotein A